MNENLIELSFEEALKELETTVAKLEVGDLTLEESLTLYERGQKLAVFCNQKLESATLRIEQLSGDGEIITLDPTAID